jgi:hypothetical protein
VAFFFLKAPKRDGGHGSPWPVVAITLSPEHGSDFREMAMNNKMIFVALGYVLLLAGLGFALDAGVAATFVLP